MVELRGDLDLAEESLRTQRGGQLRLEDLDGDLAAMLQVVGKIDRGHATSAEFAIDAVALADGVS